MASKQQQRPLWYGLILMLVLLATGCQRAEMPPDRLPTRVAPAAAPPASATPTRPPTAVPTSTAALPAATPTSSPMGNELPGVIAPKPASASRVAVRNYAVETGDSLWSIAARFGVSVEKIRTLNGLAEGAVIYPGQELLLSVDPVAAAAAPPRPAEGQPPARSEPEVAPVVASPTVSAPDRQPGGAATLATIGGPWTGPIVEQDTGYCDVVDGFGWNGTLAWPVATRVIKENRGFRPGHTALDLLANAGDPVYAAAPGVVIWAGFNIRGYGNLVVLAHGGGWQTHYVHLNDVTVSCGQSVASGQTIGHVGRTGGASFYHLHFELRHREVAYHPLDFLP